MAADSPSPAPAEAYELIAQLTTSHYELLEVLKEARSVIAIACGDKAPYARIALNRIDAALGQAQKGQP